MPRQLKCIADLSDRDITGILDRARDFKQMGLPLVVESGPKMVGLVFLQQVPGLAGMLIR
jgi:hypothetical protein